MGKKTPLSSPTSPTSPSAAFPRMDAPPPYEQVVSSSRRSSGISLHSVDPLNPTDADGHQAAELPTTQNRSPTPAADVPSAATARQNGQQRSRDHKSRLHEDGGCLNFGQNVDGCCNIGGGWNSGKTSGCMNIGGGHTYQKTDGCMNYRSPDGCMNYKSSGGCMNYKSSGGCMNIEVDDDWQNNEGCMNFRRGGGCLLRA